MTRRCRYVLLALLAAAPAWAAPCPTTHPVYVGGVAGFDALGDPAATATLRATGRAGLYLHFNALPPSLFAGRLAAVYDTFRPSGPAVAELGFGFLDNALFTGTQFRAFFSGMGQVPWAALVNAPDNFVHSDKTVADWRRQAEAARALGVGLFVPVTAPNDDVGVAEDPARSPVFAHMREVALAMGGVAVDAPPRYFLEGDAEGPRYRDWLVRWVRWAADAGLRVFWIVSPDQSGDRFAADTQMLVAYLAAHDALPHHWVVENYTTATEITRVEVTAPGRGYTTATATASVPEGAGGVEAVVRPTLRDGHVTEIGVIDGGAGYLTATVAIEGDGQGAAARAVVVPRGGDNAHASIPGNPRLPNPNIVGRDDLPQSIAGVALLVAREAPVRPWAGGCR